MCNLSSLSELLTWIFYYLLEIDFTPFLAQQWYLRNQMSKYVHACKCLIQIAICRSVMIVYNGPPASSYCNHWDISLDIASSNLMRMESCMLTSLYPVFISVSDKANKIDLFVYRQVILRGKQQSYQDEFHLLLTPVKKRIAETFILRKWGSKEIVKRQ